MATGIEWQQNRPSGDPNRRSCNSGGKSLRRIRVSKRMSPDVGKWQLKVVTRKRVFIRFLLYSDERARTSVFLRRKRILWLLVLGFQDPFGSCRSFKLVDASLLRFLIELRFIQFYSILFHFVLFSFHFLSFYYSHVFFCSHFLVTQVEIRSWCVWSMQLLWATIIMNYFI